MREAQPMILSCGEPVESTDYDFLEGIARRYEHPSYPEPEVAMIFKRSESDTSVDLFEVELALRRAYQEVYNIILYVYISKDYLHPVSFFAPTALYLVLDVVSPRLYIATKIRDVTCGT